MNFKGLFFLFLMSSQEGWVRWKQHENRSSHVSEDVVDVPVMLRASL